MRAQRNVLTPVTALSLHGKYIFAGEGPSLKIYDRNTSTLCSTLRIFESQAIHGIVYQDNVGHDDLLLLWGGPSVRIVSITRGRTRSDPPQLRPGPVLDAFDWILYAAFAPTGQTDPSKKLAGSASAALVTAHNVAYYVSIPNLTPESPSALSDSRLKASIHELTSTSRCILYSAHLVWISASSILIASGTVFGQVLVWSCCVNSGSTYSTSESLQTHHTLTGHDGSIFGVHISPEVKLVGGSDRHRCLASCSDDRTIRIWDISNIVRESQHTARADSSSDSTHYEQHRVTNVSHSERNHCCIATAWGHSSRIWDVRFLEPQNSSDRSLESLSLVSRGEDATCQLWTLRFASSSFESANQTCPSRLENEEKYACHNGRNLWSMAVTEIPEDKPCIVTGGADGGITTYSPSSAAFSDSPSFNVAEEWLTGEVMVATIAEPLKKDVPTMLGALSEPRLKSDAFNSYSFLKSSDFLVTMHNGSILRGSLNDSGAALLCKRVSWSKLGQSDHLMSYSVSTSVPSQDVAFVGGSTGVMMCYDDRSQCMSELSKLDGKVAGIFAWRPSHGRDVIQSKRRVIDLLVTRISSNVADLFTLGVFADQTQTLSVHTQISVALPEDFIATSACSVVVRGFQKILFVGARNGHLGFCVLKEDPTVIKDCNQSHVVSLDLLSNQMADDAITSLSWIPCLSNEPRASLGYLMSTARDGTFAVGRIVADSGPPMDVSLVLVHRSLLPFGPNVEGAYLAQTGELLLYGFRTREFILWDETNHNELMSIDCGGSHRNWAFWPLERPTGCTGGTLVWTKASRMHLHSTTVPSHQVVKSGGHGREIKAVAVCPKTAESEQNRLLATGAEDTDIRIFEISSEVPNASSFRCIRTLRKHNTGIQHLHWSDNGRYLFSSGGFEEFFVWRVRRIPVLGVGVVCESKCPPSSALPDLRITSFAVRNATASASAKHDAAFLISMVYSDSTVKIYSYVSRRETKEFTLLHSGNYMTSCLTQVTRIAGKDSLLTAGTDGFVALWEDEGKSVLSSENAANPTTLHWHTRHRIHQNTLKCLALTVLAANTHLLVTGGDDNALGFSILRFDTLSSSSRPSLSTLLIPRAHAAAVTAVSILEPPPPRNAHRSHRQRLIAISAGNDQRIKVWEIVFDLQKPGVEGVDVKRLHNWPSTVADIAAMVVYFESSSAKLISGGIGLEEWQMNLPDYLL